jgi:hypothetical protein
VKGAIAVALLAVAASAAAADRPARVITPDGSPLELDPHRAVLFDSPAVWVGIRNVYSKPINYALRVWIFTSDGALRGTLDYCTGDVLDRAMRSRVQMFLEIKGVTVRDRAVVTVLRAASDGITWTLRDSDAEQFSEARSAANGGGGHLRFERQESRDAQPWTCPCDCHAIQQACGETCERGAAAFTCAPVNSGVCSASCTCK